MLTSLNTVNLKPLFKGHGQQEALTEDHHPISLNAELQAPLQQDTLQLQKPSQQQNQAQLVTEVQKELQAAKTKHYTNAQQAATQKTLALSKTLQKMKTVAQQQPQTAEMAEQLQKLDTILNETQQLRSDLLSKKQANIPHYNRPVTLAEEKNMDRMLRDLVHPDANYARETRQALIKLGLSPENLDLIALKMKAHLEKSRQVRFSGSEQDNQFSLNELLKEAKQDIVKNNTSSEIVNTGLDLQIDNLANHAAPLMFGSDVKFGQWALVPISSPSATPVYEWQKV